MKKLILVLALFLVSVSVVSAVTIQRTSAALKGDMAYDGKTGLAGADALCQDEFGADYLAILATQDRRVGGTDWVLQPNTAYYNSAGDLINTTNANAWFDFPVSHGIDESAYHNIFTGLTSAGDYSGPSGTCLYWTSLQASYSGIIGQSKRTDGRLFSFSNGVCNYNRNIYCAEQVSQGPGGDEVIPEFSNAGKIVVIVIALVVVVMVAMMLMKKKQPEKQE